LRKGLDWYEDEYFEGAEDYPVRDGPHHYLYFTNWARWCTAIPPEVCMPRCCSPTWSYSLRRTFFVFQDDLKSRANETCEEIFEFLGVDSSTQINTSNSNPAAMPRSRLLHKTLRQRSLFKEFIKPFIPMRVRRPLKSKMMQVNLKETPYVPLDPQLAHEMRLSYRTEIEKLETITGRDLSSWKAE
jgi:hypothetical protein